MTTLHFQITKHVLFSINLNKLNPLTTPPLLMHAQYHGIEVPKAKSNALIYFILNSTRDRQN